MTPSLSTSLVMPSQELFAEFVARFAHLTRPHALQQADGTYHWVYEELTPALLAAHLRGDTTLALSSSDKAGRCRWFCLDLDTPDGLQTVLKLHPALAELGLPGLVEASRCGRHLWLFLEQDWSLVATARAAVLADLEVVRATGVELPRAIRALSRRHHDPTIARTCRACAVGDPPPRRAMICVLRRVRLVLCLHNG